MALDLDSEQAAIAEVVAAEERRCQAFVAGDVVAMAELLDDELTYAHTSGRREDKASYLKSVENPKGRKRRLERKPFIDVRIYGDVALAVGDFVIAFETEIGSGSMTIYPGTSLQVWVKRSKMWRLAAHQGSRTP